MKSLFTGIDSASNTTVSSAQVIYSFMPLFHLFVYFIVIANIFVSNRSPGTVFDGFWISFPDSMFQCTRVFFFWKRSKNLPLSYVWTWPNNLMVDESTVLNQSINFNSKFGFSLMPDIWTNCDRCDRDPADPRHSKASGQQAVNSLRSIY